jgi:uncharacterized protein YbjQ (UPF0145 family)
MIYTVDCPSGHSVIRTFALIESTTVVGMSSTTAWKKILEGDGPTHRDALFNFGEMAPKGANAVVGVRLSTTTIVDGDGRISLVLSYVGTPVQLDPPPVQEAL